MKPTTDYTPRTDAVLQTPDLTAFWTFQDDDFVAVSPDQTRLETVREAPLLEAGGVFGPMCARFQSQGAQSRGFLRATAQDAPQLSIGGTDARVTIVAWLKRAPQLEEHWGGCQFVAGVWNEHGRRQYAMFLNLAIHDSSQQVGAHISNHGGPTPGYGYCMDAAIGATKVDSQSWHCAAISYDGERARVFLDGELDARAPADAAGGNPYFYPGGLLKGDADFTIGAVERPKKVVANADGSFTEQSALLGNPYIGCLGGLAVFERALTESEIRDLARVGSLR